ESVFDTLNSFFVGNLHCRPKAIPTAHSHLLSTPRAANDCRQVVGSRALSRRRDAHASAHTSPYRSPHAHSVVGESRALMGLPMASLSKAVLAWSFSSPAGE